MTHGHAHEEADHASHHAADPFDKRIAMTMVVIAALLASVKVLGHRAHNDTLGYQIKAGVAQTEASNLRSFFQAKRQRMELARLQASQLELLAPLRSTEKQPAPADEPLPDKEKALEAILKDLEKEKVKDPKTEANKIVTQGEARYRALRKEAFMASIAEKITTLEMNAQRYQVEAEAINHRADEKAESAYEYRHKSEHIHHKTNFYDLGELGVELGLVLCSVAILTKRAGYWFAGMGAAVVGVILVVVGLFV